MPPTMPHWMSKCSNPVLVQSPWTGFDENQVILFNGVLRIQAKDFCILIFWNKIHNHSLQNVGIHNSAYLALFSWSICIRILSGGSPSKAQTFKKLQICLLFSYNLVGQLSPLVNHKCSTSEPNIFLRICTHTQTIIINNDLCPPMSNNIAPMPTQNPWAWTWVWAPNVGLCSVTWGDIGG
jgi:hypothetical protein